jgi:hypothetical protein
MPKWGVKKKDFLGRGQVEKKLGFGDPSIELRSVCALACVALRCFALLCVALLCFALLCFALLCFGRGLPERTNSSVGASREVLKLWKQTNSSHVST